ncbi:LamG domain-containing protein, partial [Nanoarchaeota archaeon]
MMKNRGGAKLALVLVFLIVGVLLIGSVYGYDLSDGDFFDGFESGSLSANWTLIGSGTPGEQWQIIDYTSYEGTYACQADPDALEEILQLNISTAGYSSIKFSFYPSTTGLDTNEYIAVDWYNGTGWTNLMQAEDVAYALYNYSLSSAADNNADFKVRFRCYSGSNNERCRVDNINVSGTLASASAPTYTQFSTNASSSTKFGETAWFAVNWTDSDNLSTIILSINNGSWYNVSSIGVTGNISYIYNTTYTIDAAGGSTFQWMFYANDSNNTWGVTTASSITVANTIPTHTTPTLTSTSGGNLPADNLTCNNQSTYDPDDNVKNIFNWYKGSESTTVLNMPFEAGSNSTWTKDYSPYGNNGTVTSTTWNSTGGYDGKGAYDFDGANSYITIADNPSFDFNTNTPFSISLWVKSDVAPDQWDTILVRATTNFWADGYAVFWDNGPVIKFYINGYDEDFATVSVTPTDWTHIVGVYNGTALRIFANGVEGTADTSITGSGLDIAAPIRIGSHDGQYEHDGQIDEILIFNHSLSAEQVKALYQNRTDLIVSQETSTDDIWQCEITPNDGYDDGTTLQSNSLTIVEYDGEFISPDTSQEFMGNEIVNIEFNETNKQSDIFNLTFLINGTTYQGLNNTGNGADYWNYTWTVPVGLGTGNQAITAQMRNSSGGLLASETQTIIITPRLTSVTVSSGYLKGGSQITFTAVNENDPSNGTLTLYCGETTTPSASNYNCTNSDSSPPYSLACAFSTETDTASHTKYCRVYNGQYYSKVSSANYTTDSTPPSTSVVNVASDTTVPYYDTVNDGFTNITISGEVNMACRYSTADQTYTDIGSIGQDCTVTGTQAVCPVQPAQGTPDYYVSCQDNYTNDQSTSQNLDVTSLTVDWTAPTSSDNSNTNVQVPTYQVTITESDNIDGDPESYYCTDTIGACNPTTAIDNGGQVSFTSSNRGVNYLIYYSQDYVGNSQNYENKTININQLPVFTSATDDTTTIKGGTTVIITTDSSDADSGQTLRLFVCNSTSVTYAGCSDTTYCSNITGPTNSTCNFTSETDDTTHTWYAYIYDSLNESAASNYSGSYTTDSTAPSITILNPENNSNHTQTSITAQISLSSAGEVALYSLGEAANVSMNKVSDTLFSADISGLADLQQHNITFYVNDSLGNWESSDVVYLNIDTTAGDITPPSIMVIAPTNDSVHTSAVLLNISLSENASAAWYSLDDGANTSLGNQSKTLWNATITPSEAIHNIIFYANDTSSNKNTGISDTIVFTYDITAPTFSAANITPTTVNDNSSVTCYSSWSDNVQLSIGVVEENSTGTFVNHTVSLSGTSNDVNYTISEANLTVGSVTCRFYANDTTGNLNSTSISFTVNDATPPGFNNISYVPSTEDGLDLNVMVNITANVTDNYNVSLVKLQYRQSNESSFLNFTMNNTSGDIYEGNFTPNAETNWTFRIFAEDNAGNQNTSSQITLLVAQENSFAIAETLPSIKSITTSERGILNLGNITINNTGDSSLNFTITSDVSWLDFNGTGDNAINLTLA